MEVSNSTFNLNLASGLGGALAQLKGTIQLDNATIADNLAAAGGNIYVTRQYRGSPAEQHHLQYSVWWNLFRSESVQTLKI